MMAMKKATKPIHLTSAGKQASRVARLSRFSFNASSAAATAVTGATT
jgi:hypothetical protein